MPDRCNFIPLPQAPQSASLCYPEPSLPNRCTLTEKWSRKGIIRRKMLGNLLKLSKIFNLESYKTKLQAKDWKAELSTAAAKN
jgi:hypothetical protein